MLSATIRNHIFSPGSQSRFAGDFELFSFSLLTIPNRLAIIILSNAGGKNNDTDRESS